VIDGLTQLVCLTMLQLHKSFRFNERREGGPVVTPQTGHAWNLLMNEEKLSQGTGPVILAIVQESIESHLNDNTVQRMTSVLEKDPTCLVAMTELLRSQVFHSVKTQQMTDAFYLVIYGWLVKAYRFFTKAKLLGEVEQV